MDGVPRWKNREEFEDMAKKDEYIEEAYNELKKLSHDEQMRMEYELRQKAIRDHNMMMKTARKQGYESGYEAGEKHGYEKGERLALKKVIDQLTGNAQNDRRDSGTSWSWSGDGKRNKQGRVSLHDVRP